MAAPLNQAQTTAAVVDGLIQATNTLNIGELQIDTKDKYEMTKVYKRYMQKVDRLMVQFDKREAKDKAAMLLIAIGEKAAARYDLEAQITTEANEYLNTRARLEKIFCVPDPSVQARIHFNGIDPVENESPLQFIERLKESTQMCGFDHPGQKVMKMMLSKCPNQKWQERRAIKKWDHTKLADAEEYARVLEQTHLFTGQLKKQYSSSPRVNAVKAAVKKCGYCGLEHAKYPEGRCPAYGQQCF